MLKDYGYMAIMDYVDERPDAHRILEFGHGFNATLFERYGRQRDVWGIDDCQGLSYFTTDPVEWERRFTGFHPLKPFVVRRDHRPPATLSRRCSRRHRRY